MHHITTIAFSFNILIHLCTAKPTIIGLHRSDGEGVRVDAEDLLRPLENMADRFLRSETMDVVDILTARTIEGVARLVDGAGLAVMTMVDRLPQTIDRVADTVEDVVENADNIGREVAVIVSAPARVIFDGLNPDGTNEEQVVVEEVIISRKSVNKEDSAVEDIPESVYEGESSASNVIKNSSDGLRRWSVGEDLDRDTRSSVKEQGNEVKEGVTNEKGEKNEGGKKERDRKPLTNFLKHLGISLHRRLRNENKAKGNTKDGVKQKNVFERNFENSKTQQSIQKLEDEIGGFLGRLIGTMYRNADNIDESLSGGLRRLIGNSKENISTAPIKSASRTLDKVTTSVPTLIISLDDIDPAPVKNAALEEP